MQKITLEQSAYWSELQRIAVDMRLRGNKIDMEKLTEGINVLQPKVDQLRHAIYQAYQEKINQINSEIIVEDWSYDIDSPKQLSEMLMKLGYKLPQTENGNDSTSSKWLKEQDEPLLKLIVEYRTTKKILNDFFIKIRDMQQYTCPEAYCGAKYGRIFPELLIFGAVKTGRTSCSNPNIQNQPSDKHEEVYAKKYGKLIRSIYVGENPNNDIYVMDFNSQESRVQVHYGYILKLDGAAEVREALLQNPNLSLHKYSYSVMYGIPYNSVTNEQKNFVKPINLGLSYGMQSGSLAKNLGLPTKWITSFSGYKFEVAGEEAQAMLDLHKEHHQYVYDLMSKARQAMVNRGYIITLEGRKLYRENTLGNKKPRDYKAFNSIIQGSCSDIGYKTLRLSYEKGILPLLYIHDEFVVEGLENANIVKYNMERGYTLEVPMVVDVKIGKNWGETIDINLDEVQDVREENSHS
jgi:DNA polymerase-1